MIIKLLLGSIEPEKLWQRKFEEQYLFLISCKIFSYPYALKVFSFYIRMIPIGKYYEQTRVYDISGKNNSVTKILKWMFNVNYTVIITGYVLCFY